MAILLKLAKKPTSSIFNVGEGIFSSDELTDSCTLEEPLTSISFRAYALFKDKPKEFISGYTLLRSPVPINLIIALLAEI